jgi:hypothetical protein
MLPADTSRTPSVVGQTLDDSANEVVGMGVFALIVNTPLQLCAGVFCQ